MSTNRLQIFFTSKGQLLQPVNICLQVTITFVYCSLNEEEKQILMIFNDYLLPMFKLYLKFQNIFSLSGNLQIVSSSLAFLIKYIFFCLFTEEDMDPAEKLFLTLGGSQTSTPPDNKNPLEKEFETYSALPCPSERGKVNVLQWQKNHERHLPLLAGMAKAVCCVPASSAPSERVFSGAGNIVTAQRYNLDPNTTEMLTFCQQNWSRLQQHR